MEHLNNIKKSDSIDKLAKALLLVQSELGAAKKGASNPFFKSKYADLGAVIEVVKEPLNKHGISYLQFIVGMEVETMLLHESGQWMSGNAPIKVSKENDPQAFGSAVTYTKRYALQAALGIPSEDDDGEFAMGRGKSTKTGYNTSDPKTHYGQPINTVVNNMPKFIPQPDMQDVGY